MLENNANGLSSQNDEYDNSFTEYLSRASQACASGDKVLGMHLYLAAFERAQHTDNSAPDKAALEGLKQAWKLACSLKERSIAEYVFERLEPYLSSDEAALYAEQLQNLALDKLEEFGLSRDDLQDVTDLISQDFFGFGPPLLQIKQASPALHNRVKTGNSAETSVKMPLSASVDKPAALSDAVSRKDGADATVVSSSFERITYRELVGYDKTVAVMRDFGVGMQDDPSFQQLVRELNERHGLNRMPAADTLLFRSPAREDANRFMVATLGELDLPALRMHMEENLQGMSVLCVMAQADRQPKLNASRNAFEGAGILLLEDLDLWVAPVLEPAGDDFGGFLMASLSRGAREAISLIRSAVESPDVFVLASASDIGDIDPFFYDLLEPLSIVDIDYPTASERADIWAEIGRSHPSLQGIDRELLVRFSARLSRFDIYMAAREAVEEAYKESLVARRYVPVAANNLFEKLAAYQPLDSDEYHALEDAVVSDFKQDLDRLEDLLQGGEG